MRINGSIPIHIARAYGLPPTKNVAPVRPSDPIEKTGRADAPPTQRGPGNIEKLVAGKVPGAVDFASASTPTSPAGAYQLYTRAADKIEAAVAVQLGRNIDVTA